MLTKSERMVYTVDQLLDGNALVCHFHSKLMHLRRWRISEQALSKSFSGINYYLDYATMKYKVVVVEDLEAKGRASAPALFRSHYYYLPITIARTGQNSSLVENPGY
jgi:hypothetical protein